LVSTITHHEEHCSNFIKREYTRRFKKFKDNESAQECDATKFYTKAQYGKIVEEFKTLN
jgi:hypothetical protein